MFSLSGVGSSRTSSDTSSEITIIITIVAIVKIVLIIAGLIWKGKLPCLKSTKPKKRRFRYHSGSSNSSSDESDKESSNKRKRPKTALRSKTKVRLPPVKSAKVETLPKVSIKGQSKLPPIAKKWSAQFTMKYECLYVCGDFYVHLFKLFFLCVFNVKNNWKLLKNESLKNDANEFRYTIFSMILCIIFVVILWTLFI